VVDLHTEWPARREEYAYRKCLDGRLEYIDSADTPFVWGERPGEHLPNLRDD
jgi:hypothetical protein